jgi:hypothetical protein
VDIAAEAHDLATAVQAVEREAPEVVERGTARALHRTVESHVAAVLKKLQLANRHQLAHWAAQRRLTC